MAILISSGTTGGLSQFGDLGGSQGAGTERLFGFSRGLGDIIAEFPVLYDTLQALPWSYVDESGFRIDTPGIGGALGIPLFDIRGGLSAGIDLGLYGEYQYDFGSMSAGVTVQAERPDGGRLFGTYRLDTGATLVSVGLDSVSGQEPFRLKLFTASANDPSAPAGAFFDASLGIYKDGSEWIPIAGAGRSVDLSVTILDLTVPQDAVLDLGGIVPYVSGSLGVPRLPDLTATAARRGASEVSRGNDTGLAQFANLAVDLDEIAGTVFPVFGALNEGDAGFKSWPVDAGIEWQVIDLNLGPTLSLQQTLDVRVLDVAVGVQAESLVNGAWTVTDTEFGYLGDAFELDFAQGEHLSRVTEYYVTTVEIKTDIDLSIGMQLDLQLLWLKAYINPKFFDEISKSFSLVDETLKFEVAAIDLVSDDSYIVTLAPVIVQWHADTVVNFKGTQGPDKILKLAEGQVNIQLLGGDDYAVGNALGNFMEGNDGDDTLIGGTTGQDVGDVLLGGAGADQLFGANGNDLLRTGSNGTAKGEIASGGPGNDRIEAEAVRGTFAGDADDDVVAVKLAAGQTITGGSGVDTLVLDGTLFSAPFVLDLTAKRDDFLQYGMAAAPGDRSSMTGFEVFDLTLGSGGDRVTGGVRGDTLNGMAGDDSLNGGSGDDVLDGGAGKDTLAGGADADTLRGGDGDDRLNGGSGDDVLEGGVGTDTLLGLSGDDTLRGGTGDDSLEGGTGSNLLLGSEGNDTLRATGADQAYGEAGNDLVIGGSQFAILSGGDGDDTLRPGGGGGSAAGGAGADRIEVTNASGPVTVYGGGFSAGSQDDGAVDVLAFDAGAIIAFGGSGTPGSPFYVPPVAIPGVAVPIVLDPAGTLGTVSFFGIDAFDVTAGSAADALVGSGGDDTLRGMAGADYLDGRGGRDLLDGGSGDDTLVATLGDAVDGGSGTDLLLLDLTGTLAARVSIGVADGGAAPVGSMNGGGTVAGVEMVRVLAAGSGDDTLSGGERADTLLGGAGDDTLDGDAGNDVLEGGDGRDSIRGGAGDDQIDLRGTDTLPGGPGDPRFGGVGSVRGEFLPGDRAWGDGGNDTIAASRTAALVDGGRGNDYIFVTDLGGLAGGPTPTLDGGLGDDTILGSDAAEIIVGGPDPVDGPPPPEDDRFVRIDPAAFAEGNDSLLGYGGDDSIDGGSGNDTLRGMLGDDRLTGGSGNDSLDGGEGVDFLFGGSGSDRLSGGAEGDALLGQAGDDTLLGDGGGDQISGGAGNDQALGGEGDDTLEGGDGNDTLQGEAGDDLLEGGAGNDLLTGGLGTNRLDGGEGNDQFVVVSGQDIVDGGAGTDLLTVIAASAPVGVSIGAALGGGLFGMGGTGTFTGIERLNVVGGMFADTLAGTGGADTLDGGLGADAIRGGVGNDTMRLGADGDSDLVTVAAGDGNDRVEGFGAEDRLLVTGATLPVLDLLDTAEGIVVRGPTTNTLLVGVSLRQATAARAEGRIAAAGVPVAKPDVLVISSGTTALFAPAVLLANDGGSPLEFAGITSAPVAIRAQVVDGVLQVQQFFNQPQGAFQYGIGNAAGTSSAAVSVRVLAASSAGDVLDASALGAAAAWLDGMDGDDRISGDAGSDRLIGGGGDDMLAGGAGIDTLDGGAGADTLDGGTGADSMTGGEGDDVYVVDDAADLVIELDGGGVDAVQARVSWALPDFVEAGSAEAAGVAVTGNALGNLLGASTSGGVGLHGVGGDDTIVGGRGADTLTGGDGGDVLRGNGGGDYLEGAGGDDLIEGGAGSDSLHGGGGFDRFVWTGVDRASVDTVLDFDGRLIGRFGGSVDLLDLSGIDANAGVAGNQAFAFVHGSEFSAAGQVRVTPGGMGLWRVEVNVDGDFAPDLVVLVDAPEPLVAANFVL